MEAVSANGAGGETAALSAFGRQWGTADRRAHENPPKLYTFNPKGFRRDVVEFHPAYHDLMRASIAAGLHASTWTATGKRASPAGGGGAGGAVLP
jgi:putative acyl-CoA dehydrogenase